MAERIGFADAGPVWLTLANMAVVRNNGRDVVDSTAGGELVPGSPEAFGYDPDNNLTSDGRWAYTWDGENRLIRMVANTSAGPQQRIEFQYDWQGRRIAKKVWANKDGSGSPTVDQRFLYDGWNLICVLSSERSPLTSFVWGSDLSGSLQGAGGVGGLLVESQISGGAVAASQFAVYDGNGNVGALVSATDGTVAARYEYGPFGEVVRITGALAKANPFRFSTKYQDDETDLLYYGYRYYNASTGRWISRDPFEEKGGLNLFVLTGNAPIERIDKDGRIPIDPGPKGCDCTCIDVEVTGSPVEPPGMGWYQDGGYDTYGNSMKVVWRVRGNAAKCLPGRDESGSASAIPISGQTTKRKKETTFSNHPNIYTDPESQGWTYVGSDSISYRDKAGIRFRDQFDEWGGWDITFKLKTDFTCTSSDGKKIIGKTIEFPGDKITIWYGVH